MKLSILICSLQKRLTQFALLCEHLQNQAHGKPVEILWLGDNKTMSVGEKRNKLLSISKGDYIAFVDDDDWVADDYVDAILKGMEQKKDCICFDAIYTSDDASPPSKGGSWVNSNFPPLEGQREAGILVHYSVNNLLNVDEPGKPRLRVPNHLIPIKREYALATKFLEKNFGEDTDYGLRIRRLLKTEYKIDRPMYYYRFSTKNSETHKYSPKYRRPTFGPMVKMDVVIVSDGSVGDCRAMTQQAINSIVSPDVNVVVLEKADNIRYANADTFLQRHPFNYNQCLNNGAAMGNAEYICFTNNDVVFPEGFVNRVVAEMSSQSLDVLSVTNHKGFIHPHIISGFCFIMRRDAWLKIGKLNTDYRFWCADNVTSEQVKQHNLREG
ncbi:MAG TPA: glycosyltransferase, partial [Bacteroidia bacterium]|nr:glycosyltransferase [Bacteroidia bacterium]